MTKKNDDNKIYCSKRGCGKEIENKTFSGDVAQYCIKCRSYFHSNCLDIRREKTDNFFATYGNVGYCPNCGSKIG